MSRTLRSNKLRAALYYAQDGKCAICGCELPDDWHADHIVPWVISHDTNVHDMQALCPNCNRAKGAKMLRKHQEQLRQISIGIRSGTIKATNILAEVTPGGGKSAFGMIVAKELAEPLGYKICWVVPRSALQKQGELNFVQQRNIFGHNLAIRATGNDTNPSRGFGGCIVTYQAITANPDLWRHEFKRHKYILILDECHHVPDKGDSGGDEDGYFTAIAPLVELAEIRIFASGTLERHDAHKIAFIRYEPAIGSAEQPVLRADDEWEVIRYSRMDALEERAIVPLHFHVMDGRAHWFDERGNERIVESIATSEGKDQAAILRTVLETKYAHDLLDRCVQSWSDHRQTSYPQAKMLVVSPTQEVAKSYVKYLNSRGVPALLAISQDSDQAQQNIDAFKRDESCLVTVGMAYEGLDVPQITHVALLTNIRSRPWIEQAICRANRMESKGGKSHGYIFLPDDIRMKRIVDAIEKDQRAVVSTVPRRESTGIPGVERIIPSIAPVSGYVTMERGQGLEDGTRTDYRETDAIQEAMRQTSIKGISPIQFKQALTVLGLAVVPNGNSPEPDYTQDVIQSPPSEQESALKTSIDRQVKRTAKGDPERIVRINTHLKQMFEDRKTAPIPVLQRIFNYVNANGEALSKL